MSEYLDSAYGSTGRTETETGIRGVGQLEEEGSKERTAQGYTDGKDESIGG